jgi:hypothetical protein
MNLMTICGCRVSPDDGGQEWICSRNGWHRGQHSPDPDSRYSYRQVVSFEEWAQAGALVLDRFLRYCTALGAPGGTPYEMAGLRLNAEGARDDRGELMTRIECDPKDTRVIEIELRTEWTA